MYEPRKSGRHARTCECAMASSTGQSSSDRLVSCIALAAVHNSPSPCPSSSPLSEVTCGTARHQKRTPFPRVSNRGGALLKKCAVPPPFPHAVPQVISRKPLVHFQVGAQHGASPCHFYVSRAPGAAPMACCKSGWCVRVGHRIGAVQACRLLLSRVALLLKLDARSGQTSLGTAALKSA